MIHTLTTKGASTTDPFGQVLSALRCERAGLLSGRCKEIEKLEADHVHPHSRGGSTTVANGQVLCSRHNKQKAARIPFNWELRRLERRRAAYFPAGSSAAVVRRGQREPLTPGSRARRG